MGIPHPFFRYTTEVLAWRLGEGPGAADAPPLPPARLAGQTARVLRHLAGQPDRRQAVLAGLGSGRFAAGLAEALPPEVGLVVLGADPEAARRLLAADALPWRTPDGSRQLLVDTSAMALFCLTVGCGLSPETSLVTVNPEDGAPAEKRELAQWRRLFCGSRPAPEVRPADCGPRPTLAVLARPEEPDLPGFFAAAAGLADRAVVLWDAVAVPAAAREAEALGVPVRHLARRLDHDFAAQRNALLAACDGPWLLCLDPDERPGPGFAAAVARIMAEPEAGGAFFPRLTLYPDAGRVKAGYGLWPDVQLRLFRRTATGPRYVRPVHERLEGLTGRAVLALDAPLYHYNRLLADRTQVEAKLSGFDAAAGRHLHRLSRDYPTLPLEFFASPAGMLPGGRVLLLPAMW